MLTEYYSMHDADDPPVYIHVIRQTSNIINGPTHQAFAGLMISAGSDGVHTQ